MISSVGSISLATHSEALWSLFHAHLRLRRDVQLLGAGERGRDRARRMHYRDKLSVSLHRHFALTGLGRGRGWWKCETSPYSLPRSLLFASQAHHLLYGGGLHTWDSPTYAHCITPSGLVHVCILCLGLVVFTCTCGVCFT